ncbi:hypothetical protein QE382_001622 [Sphingobacterium zeae]|uniref:Uncharacterized protein n=1 Tax=Sphingobacterium zeae TaxID=1776859 RepID=A0ABU0U5Z0_9SPHI|nr:hypothetical protein [Sphingobacterium zeae]
MVSILNDHINSHIVMGLGSSIILFLIREILILHVLSFPDLSLLVRHNYISFGKVNVFVPIFHFLVEYDLIVRE